MEANIKIGSWTTTSNTRTKGSHRQTLCVCECGTSKFVFDTNLKRGLSLKCTQCSGMANRKEDIDGDSNPKSKYNGIYVSYRAILNRCYLPNTNGYSSYGGAGVVVCEEWKNDYSKFKEWSLSNGWKKGYVCGRVGDTGNYEPTNCRWISKSQNSREANMGKINKNRKLDRDTVLKIRNSKSTNAVLSEQFGISKGMVGQIKRRESYKDIK